MKRRQLILASAGVASAALPGLSRSATPCPPPTVSLTGGSTASTACGAGKLAYSTNFPANENPISEGGRWRNTGLDWTPVATTGGLAYSTQTSNGYDDSYAFLSGFGANQTASGVIHLASGYNPSVSHEVEIILRCSDGPHTISWYECNLGIGGGYAQIMLLNGPIGTFREVTQTSNPIAPRNGDVFSASAVGNVITSYLNGVELARAVDSSLPTGQPGMAFFIRPGAVAKNYCFSSFSASSS
jgi:hypothetical protein